MSKLIIGHINKHSFSRGCVFLCPELYSAVMGRKEIVLAYGQKKSKALVRRSPYRTQVFLSSDVWNSLKLPFPAKMHLHLSSDQLSLGPLIGILTTGLHLREASAFGVRTPLMRRFLMAGQEVPASYFVFGPQDISYLRKEIKGHFLVSGEGGRAKFKQFWVPFPNVVYNRVPNRGLEASPPVMMAKAALLKEGVRLFNPSFFNKWTIHQKIHQIPEVRPYIPETIIDPRQEEIARMLKDYRMVYLKPSSGSLGLGIAQFYHLPQRGYFLRYRRGNQNKLFRFDHLSTALHHFMRHKSSKTYIVQQGIPLISLDGRPIDFRVHTNKNALGEWEVTAVAAKLAGKGSVTTHVRTGGRVLSAEEAIANTFPPYLQKLVRHRLEQAALALSRAIDRSMDGDIGELGFDLGLDRNGRPWMFEANAKPGRHVFNHASLMESETLTRKKIVEYALYLSRFTAEEVKV